MRALVKWGACGVLAAAAALVVPSPNAVAWACAPAPREGVPPIEVHEEEALIVWDEAKKVEHFVRRAVFDTRTKSFGFLVPTPGRPTLAEASPALFGALENATKPEEITRTAWRVMPSLLLATLGARSANGVEEAALASGVAPVVEVLEETRVAGMDATVLAANDATALARWLDERGFAFRPELRDWLAPYVEAGYVVTAFRYERPDVAQIGAVPGAEASLAPSAVRLTFPAEAPFYPYREPSDAPDVPARRLRLYVLSTARMQGGLGPSFAPWSGADVRFADALTVDEPLRAALSGVALPATAFLTELLDPASRRAPFDLTFRRASETGTVRPPPIVRLVDRTLFLPVELVIPVVLLAWWGVRRYGRRAAAR